jgi:hypothetical protein
MQKNTDFPTEQVTLPSKGLLYPSESNIKNGIIEMKYMTAKEEDILTNANLIKNGTVLDKLLQSLIVTSIDYNELLVGDKNAIMIASRILGYGSNYTWKAKHPETGEEEEITYDLTTLEDKTLDKSLILEEGKNEFEFTLPTSKKHLTFRFLTHGDEKALEQELKGLKKIGKQSAELTTRLKHTILSIDGNYDKKEIREFVDTRLLAIDSRALRKYIMEISPDVNLRIEYEYSDGYAEESDLPLGVNFFWPDASI